MVVVYLRVKARSGRVGESRAQAIRLARSICQSLAGGISTEVAHLDR